MNTRMNKILIDSFAKSEQETNKITCWFNNFNTCLPLLASDLTQLINSCILIVELITFFSFKLVVN